jgi:chromosome segregation ATPase
MLNVHTIIARAFLGERPKGYQVDHINGDKADNRPENLRYVTRQQNLRGARKNYGRSKYRGVSLNGKKWSAMVLGDRYGSFDTEEEAAERFDDVAFYEHNFSLEGLNFPQRILDKMASADTDNGMIDKTPENTSENIERIQTQIEMIRQESRILSYRIERMMEQRKGLSEEKRKLKEQLETLSV